MYRMGVEIMRKNVGLTMAIAPYGALHATTVAVTECNAGETVFVLCTEHSSEMLGDSEYRWSHFSGALLNAYI